MSEFTYTVFIVVASMTGGLITLFIGVIALAMALDTSTVPSERSVSPADSHGEYQRAA